MRQFKSVPIALLAMALATPGFAQTPLFDSGATQAACGSGDCVAGVTVALADLSAQGLADDDRNSQIGALAALVIEIARTAPASRWASLAAALDLIAAATTDPLQRLAILDAAAMTLAGNAGQIDLATAVAASPA